jgi:hypothetical protein
MTGLAAACRTDQRTPSFVVILLATDTEIGRQVIGGEELIEMKGEVSIHPDASLFFAHRGAELWRVLTPFCLRVGNAIASGAPLADAVDAAAKEIPNAGASSIFGPRTTAISVCDPSGCSHPSWTPLRRCSFGRHRHGPASDCVSTPKSRCRNWGDSCASLPPAAHRRRIWPLPWRIAIRISSKLCSEKGSSSGDLARTVAGLQRRAFTGSSTPVCSFAAQVMAC